MKIYINIPQPNGHLTKFYQRLYIVDILYKQGLLFKHYLWTHKAYIK